MPENANTNATPAAPATPAAGNAAPAEAVVSKSAHDELAGRLGSTMQKLDEATKRIAELTAKEDAAQKEQLAKNGEFQKLAETEAEARKRVEAERDALAAKYETDTKRFHLGIAAKNAGITDVNDALALIDVSKMAVKDGKVEGLDEAIAKLQTDKPYLFGAPTAPMPHGNRPAGTQLTKADLTKDYALAEKIFNENPAEYNRIMHGK